MTNRHALLTVAGAAAVLFLGGSMPTVAQNQPPAAGRQGGGRQGGGAGAFGGGAFGGQMFGQMNEMLTKMRQTRAFADPGVSNTSNLLTRPDVRNELVLNGRQTEGLAELQNGYFPAMGQQMMTTFQSVFQKLRDENGGNFDPRSMSADDRQQFQQQMQDKAQEAMFSVQSDQDKKAEALLKPEQLKRLHELDLQWRGPLALTEEKLGDQVSLTPEQRPKFAAMLKEFRAARQKAQANMMGGGPGRNGGGPFGQPGAGGAAGAGGNAGAGGANNTGGKTDPAGGNAAGGAATPAQPPMGGGFGGRGFTPPTAEQMQQAMEDANKQVDALRKTMDKKALALLTPEQQAQWKTMQGKPFTFRTNL